MDIKIRKAEAKDAVQIAEMLIDIGALHHNGRPDIYKDNLQKYNEEDIKKILKDKNTPIYVAVNEETVLGYVFCQIKTVESNKALVDRKYMYIDDFCVNKNYRKQHIGRMLMDAVFEETRKMEISSIQLNVWEFNESAIRFYEKCGFTTQKREMEIKL